MTMNFARFNVTEYIPPAAVIRVIWMQSRRQYDRCTLPRRPWKIPCFRMICDVRESSSTETKGKFSPWLRVYPGVRWEKKKYCCRAKRKSADVDAKVRRHSHVTLSACVSTYESKGRIPCRGYTAWLFHFASAPDFVYRTDAQTYVSFRRFAWETRRNNVSHDVKIHLFSIGYSDGAKPNISVTQISYANRPINTSIDLIDIIEIFSYQGWLRFL